MGLGQEEVAGVEVPGVVEGAIAGTAPGGVDPDPLPVDIGGIPGVAVAAGGAVDIYGGNALGLKKRPGQVGIAGADRQLMLQHVLAAQVCMLLFPPEVFVVIDHVFRHPPVDGLGLFVITGKPGGDLVGLCHDGRALLGHPAVGVHPVKEGTEGLQPARKLLAGQIDDILQGGALTQIVHKLVGCHALHTLRQLARFGEGDGG